MSEPDVSPPLSDGVEELRPSAFEPGSTSIRPVGTGETAIIHELQYIRVGMLDQYQAAAILERLVNKAQRLSPPPASERVEMGSAATPPRPGLGSICEPADVARSSDAHYRCTRPGCGRDEIDCRANGCPRGPCPMEFVG